MAGIDVGEKFPVSVYWAAWLPNFFHSSTLPMLNAADGSCAPKRSETD